MTDMLDSVIQQALESVKGIDIVRLDVTDLTDVMDTIFVASGDTQGR